GAAPPLAAQSLRVELVAAGSSAPVVGGILSLLDAQGARVSTALTGDGGMATLTAPSAGTYRVRAERIGFESFTSDTVTVLAGVRPLRIEMPARRVTLAGVTVREKQQ